MKQYSFMSQKVRAFTNKKAQKEKFEKYIKKKLVLYFYLRWVRVHMRVGNKWFTAFITGAFNT